jgi:hypothetical protein
LHIREVRLNVSTQDENAKRGGHSAGDWNQDGVYGYKGIWVYGQKTYRATELQKKMTAEI